MFGIRGQHPIVRVLCVLLGVLLQAFGDAHEESAKEGQTQVRHTQIAPTLRL